MRNKVYSLTLFSHALLPFLFCLYHFFSDFSVIAFYSMRRNEGCVVVYEKLTLPETMLKKLRYLRQCCFYYGIAEFETTTGMMQDESLFSTFVSGLFKVESPAL